MTQVHLLIRTTTETVTYDAKRRVCRASSHGAELLSVSRGLQPRMGMLVKPFSLDNRFPTRRGKSVGNSLLIESHGCAACFSKLGRAAVQPSIHSVSYRRASRGEVIPHGR